MANLAANLVFLLIKLLLFGTRDVAPVLCCHGLLLCAEGAILAVQGLRLGCRQFTLPALVTDSVTLAAKPVVYLITPGVRLFPTGFMDAGTLMKITRRGHARYRGQQGATGQGDDRLRSSKHKVAPVIER